MSTAAGFVGRETELRVLGERLVAAQLGQPQVVYIEGDPGAGKSTLLARFLSSVSDAAILEVSCDEAEMTLSYGVADQFHLEGSLEPGIDPMAVGAQLLDRLDQLQAEGQVAVLAVDDLQWADRPSSRALLFALRRLRADKVLTVLSTRLGELGDPGWSRFVAGDSRVTRLRLGGLSATNLTELASALGLGQLSERGASQLVAHTDGNALYSRALLDELGVAALSTVGNSGLPAPRDLSAVILARTGALTSTTQAFIGAASVVGQHGPVATIRAVAGLADAHQEVHAAIAAGLMVEGPSLAEVTFAHPLYRAAVYADLSAPHRRGLHSRAAELVGGRARLAHLVAASPGSDEPLAADLEASAAATSDIGDWTSSAWAMEHAAALSPAASDRERRLLHAAEILLNAADTTAARRVLSQSEESSPRRDALLGLLEVFSGSPTAEVRLLAAWNDHDPLTEKEIGARAATSLINWMVVSGRPDEGLAWADRAIGATTAGSPLRAMARTGQAYALAADRRSAEGLRVLGFLPDSGSEVRITETDALIMRGILKVYTDDLAGAISDLSIATARLRSGLPSTYPVPCLVSLSDAHFRRGDWDAAIAHAQMATFSAQDTDRPLDLTRAHSRAAHVLAFRGQWDAAESHLAAARSAAERFPFVLAVAAASTAAAALASARGDLGGVLIAVESVRATRHLDVGGCPGIFNWRAMEVDALIGLGRADDASEALRAYEAAVAETGLASAALSAARCRGNLAVAQGLAPDADDAFARAHELEPEVPMPFERALLSLDHGRHLHHTADPSAAVSQLELAHHIFSDLGADPYVQACAEDLATLRVTAATSSTATLLGLSRAELAVARLVATGLTNREAADQLYLSVKTIEYHLRNTYMKLDITSRRDLAALVD
jgi:DNA-binding CsgD family transcriptional regulator/tetratricopeptide (TPR) repeat protein